MAKEKPKIEKWEEIAECSPTEGEQRCPECNGPGGKHKRGCPQTFG